MLTPPGNWREWYGVYQADFSTHLSVFLPGMSCWAKRPSQSHEGLGVHKFKQKNPQGRGSALVTPALLQVPAPGQTQILLEGIPFGERKLTADLLLASTIPGLGKMQQNQKVVGEQRECSRETFRITQVLGSEIRAIPRTMTCREFLVFLLSSILRESPVPHCPQEKSQTSN